MLALLVGVGLGLGQLALWPLVVAVRASRSAGDRRAALARAAAAARFDALPAAEQARRLRLIRENNAACAAAVKAGYAREKGRPC